jgi:hypothetical protein
MTLGSSITLKPGHTYYFAIWADAAATYKRDTSGNVTYYQTFSAGAYSGTMPSSTSGFIFTTTSTGMITLSGAVTVTNAGCVNEPTENGATSYVADSTVGDYDLYDVDDLVTIPSTILGVSLRAFLSKSDAGARSGKLTMKSGSTSHDTSAQVLSTTFQNLVEYIDVDPDTGSAWTAIALNAVQIGPKVAA